MTTIRITVRSDIEKAKRQFRERPLQVRKAAARAINRTADRINTQFYREIREAYTAKRKALARRIRVRKRASIYALKAEIEASGNPLPITDFSVSKGRRGVSVKIRKGGARTRFNKAFVLRAPNGDLIVARGRYRGNQFVPNKAETPIRLVGPGVPQMFNAQGVQRRIQSFADRTFAERFEHELRRAIR